MFIKQLNKIKLIDYELNIYKYLKKSNFYISTSIWEGSSLAMVDAAYVGIPILCSDCPSGRREFIDNNEKDLFIYNLDIYECIWYIINFLTNHNRIPDDKIADVLIAGYNFFKYYNNNYRPIYHLENYTLYLISILKKNENK